MRRAWIGVLIAATVSAVVLAGARSGRTDRSWGRNAGWNGVRQYGPQQGYGPGASRSGGPMRGGRGYGGGMDRFGGGRGFGERYGFSGGRGRGPVGPGPGMRRGPGGFEGPGRGLEALDLTDEQKEAIKALHEKIKADLEAGMAEILTEEQLARLEEIKERTGGPWGPGHPGAGPLGVLRGLELTEDQQAEVKTIMEAAKEKLEAAETPEARKAAFEAAIDEVKELLTPEQLEQLEKALPRFKERPGGPLGGGILACAEQIGLTDEQITQIKAIEEQTRAAVDAAETIEARHEALQDGREAVEKVLTAEQLEKLKECMAQQRPGRGEGRRPGGYRGPRPGGGPGGFRPGRRG